MDKVPQKNAIDFRKEWEVWVRHVSPVWVGDARDAGGGGRQEKSETVCGGDVETWGETMSIMPVCKSQNRNSVRSAKIQIQNYFSVTEIWNIIPHDWLDYDRFEK
jgi:hypothetical protein